MACDIERPLRAVRDTLLAEPVSPRVERPRDVNRHYCRYVAETVVDRVGDCDVGILEDGANGFAHVWLVHDGRHYDAECVEGVEDYRELPFFRRHPEAVMHAEPPTADQPRLRRRGTGSLYPDEMVRRESTTDHWWDPFERL